MMRDDDEKKDGDEKMMKKKGRDERERWKTKGMKE
jgi:hypothetical protein